LSDKRYVVGGADGWLNVKRERSGEIIGLPEYLQVEARSSENDRDYFTVLEGVEKNKMFSVKAGNLKIGSPSYRPPARLTFSISKKKLSFPGGEIKAITVSRNPPPLGTIPIQIPDFLHIMGAAYQVHSLYAKTWFHLGQGHAVSGNNSTDRYLHTGLESAGCITVDPASWTRLYQYLILCRGNDGKTVGSVSVVR